MSESVKKVAGLIGLAALAITGVGVFAVGISGAAAFGSVVVSFSTLATIGYLGLSIYTTPTIPTEQTGAGDRGTPYVDPSATAVYAFGTTILPSVLIYEESYYPTSGYTRHHLTDIFAHCWHRIQGYVSATFGTPIGPQTVTFDGSGVPNGAYASLIGHLSWSRAIGTQVAALQWGGSNWPSTAIGEGITHSAFTHAYEEQFWQDFFGGTPRQIEIVAQCAWLYDPRLDPAYGSGTQDFDDPTTWSFNNGNLVLALLRALIGEYAGTELVWGRGVTESEVNMASFVAMANVADETVDGKPRFRGGGVHVWDGNWQAFVQRWEQETGGKLSRAGGKFTVWLPHDDLTAVTTITESMLVEGVALEHTLGGLENLYNTARGRYIEPTEGYKAFAYPEVTEASAVTADGGKRVLAQDFSWIQDVSIAERIARIKVRRSRFQRIWIVGLNWVGHGPNYEVFTVHNLNCKETNNTNQLVRVIDRQLHMNGIAVLILQEENAAIYDDTIALGTPNTATPPANYNNPVTPLGFAENFTHIPPFAPGLIGGSSNFAFFANFTAGGASDPGEIRITGTVFRHPDGTDRYVDDADDVVSTSYGEGVSGKFFLMWSDANPETRFTTLGTFTHSNICAVFYGGASDGWFATDNEGDFEAFTPLGTDCLIGIGMADNTTGGITRFISLIDGNLPQYTNSILNGDFEGGSVGWIPAGLVSVVESVANAYFGTHAAFFNNAAAGAYIGNTAFLPVAPGDRVLASAYAKRTAGNGDLRVVIDWHDNTGAYISTSSGNDIATSTYTQSRVIAEAPANAASARFYVVVIGGTGTTGYADGCIMTVTVRDSDIDALDTINGPIEAGADSTGNALPAISGSSLLPNWYFGISDSIGKPAGIRGVESIADRTQVQFGGIGIQILSSPDTVVAYGFPAIPIDDRKQYSITIRHASSTASVDGLYLRMFERASTLPVGKTHIGVGSGEDVVATRDSQQFFVSNAAMPGTTPVENTYVYTPTPGTLFASFAMINSDPDTAGVVYEVAFVQMRELPTKTAHFIGNVPVDEFYDIMNYSGAPSLTDGEVLEKRWTRIVGTVPNSEIVRVTGDTQAPGGTYMRFGNNSGDDYWGGYFNGYLIPYDGVSLYEVGVMVRRIAGSGVFYFGLEGLLADGTTMVNRTGADGHGNQHHFAASNVNPGTSWQIYKGYVQGTSGTPTVDNTNDSLNPGQMYTGTVYIRPLTYLNYVSVAGQYEIAAAWVKRIPGSVSALDIITASAISVGNLAAISADLGSITAGSIVLPSGGFIRSGQTAFNTGTGFYLGNDSGTPKFSIGDSSDDYLAWDGTLLDLSGQMNLKNAVQTFTPTWSGFSSAPSGDLNYLDFGAFVLLYAPANRIGTSDGTAMSFSGLPTAVRPSISVVTMDFNIVAQGVLTPGYSVISTGGVVQFFAYQQHPSNNSIIPTSNPNSNGTLSGLSSGNLLIYFK